ncbi:hypothetical protein M3689_11980 [Alkalihalophilus marmarensis]|uniref:hypothetical protein n=1 Tax=Alkalihalophilus marmarensis TaxID=521377 RepID=UPI00203D9B29|nr:hypothetical protein [Alkalihalophilus marmarensis]MCM3490029.1 hypothetical protein [Alkalihalophilus marmarensis]
MKNIAWDSVGLNFWKLGRDTAKPSSETLSWFTQGISNNSKVLIIGGTTVDVINAMEKLGTSVSVVDFSLRICNELRDYVSTETNIVHQDIVNNFKSWGESFDLICSDTLINRFDWDEATRFQNNLYSLLNENGKIRSTVKIGMYPMDHELIDYARNNSIAADFWEEESKTIDYSKAKPILENGLLPHGNINKDDLLAWYGNRGKEKRFEENDLRLLFNNWSGININNDYGDRVRVEVEK